MSVARALAHFNQRHVNRFILRFAGSISPFSIVVHRGRRSGIEYRTPVWAFPVPQGLVFAALYGSDSDWVKNVIATHGARVLRRRVMKEYEDPTLVGASDIGKGIPGVFRVIFRMLRVSSFVVMQAREDTIPDYDQQAAFLRAG